MLSLSWLLLLWTLFLVRHHQPSLDGHVPHGSHFKLVFGMTKSFGGGRSCSRKQGVGFWGSRDRDRDRDSCRHQHSHPGSVWLLSHLLYLPLRSTNTKLEIPTPRTRSSASWDTWRTSPAPANGGGGVTDSLNRPRFWKRGREREDAGASRQT